MLHLALIALYLVVLPSFALSILTNRRIELYIAIILPFYSIWLYLCGLANCLSLGRYAINIGIVGLVLYSVFQAVLRYRKKEFTFFGDSLKKNVLTPGLLIFLLGIAFASYLSYGRIYSSWDEFSHWGKSVRILFKFNVLPIKTPETISLLGYPSYPQGTGLLGYLFSKQYSSTVYYEYTHVFSMEVLLLGLFIVFIYNAKWRNFFCAFLLSLSLFVITMTYNTTFFTTVYVDTLLGVTLAASIYISFTCRMSSLRNSAYLAILLAFLILIKQSGVGLAIIALIPQTIFGIILITKKIFRKDYKRSKKYLFYFLPYSAFIINIIHKKSLVGIKEAFSSGKITLRNVLDGYYFNSNEVFSEIQKKMIDEIFFKNKESFFVPASYFSIVLLCVITLFFLKRNARRRDFVLNLYPLTIFLGFLIYSFTLFLYYNFSFSSYEALRLASFDRYMSTYLIFSSLTACGISFSFYNRQPENHLYQAVLLSIFFISFINQSNLNEVKTFFDPVSNQSMAEYSSVLDQIIKQNMSDEDNFILISQGSQGLQDRICSAYYLKNYTRKTISWGESKYEGDIWSRKYSEKEVMDLIAANKFCYILNTDQYLLDNYSKFFDTLYPDKRNLLYQSRNGKYCLVPLKEFVFDFEKASLFDVTKQNKAGVDYSARKGNLIARLMKDGEIELKPKAFCPLWNGNLNKISIDFGETKGESSLIIRLNGVTICDEVINPATNNIQIDIPNIILNNLTIHIRGISEYSTVIFNRVTLGYSGENNSNLYLTTPFDLYTRASKKVISPNSFSVQGKQIVLSSSVPFNNPIPKNGKLSFSGKISNKGKTTPTVYIGWAAYNKDKKQIWPPNVRTIAGTDTVLVQDLIPESNVLYVEDASKWNVDENTTVFFDTKTDMSDLPNYSNQKYGNIKVLSIKKEKESLWKIELDKSIKTTIKKGTGVRLHNSITGAYLYSQIFVLPPGEEKAFDVTVNGFSNQNDYTPQTGWPKGSEYVSIVILSYSGQEDSILIEDLTLRPLSETRDNSTEENSASKDIGAEAVPALNRSSD